MAEAETPQNRAIAAVAKLLPASAAHAEAVVRAVLNETQPGWRPIDESTPRHGNYARVSVEEGVLYCPSGGEATHWMPLPAPPREASDAPAQG